MIIIDNNKMDDFELNKIQNEANDDFEYPNLIYGSLTLFDLDSDI